MVMRGKKRHIKKWAKQQSFEQGGLRVMLGLVPARIAFRKARNGAICVRISSMENGKFSVEASRVQGPRGRLAYFDYQVDGYKPMQGWIMMPELFGEVFR